MNATDVAHTIIAAFPDGQWEERDLMDYERNLMDCKRTAYAIASSAYLLTITIYTGVFIGGDNIRRTQALMEFTPSRNGYIYIGYRHPKSYMGSSPGAVRWATRQIDRRICEMTLNA